MRRGWMPGSSPGVTDCWLRRLGARAFLRRRDRTRRLDLGDLRRAIAELLAENFLRMLAEQRRASHFGDRVRHLDGVADGEILAARGVIDLDHGAGLAQRRLLGDLLHRQDRADRNVDRVANVHDLELGLGHGPLLDRIEDVAQPRQPRRRRGVVGVGLRHRLAERDAFAVLAVFGQRSMRQALLIAQLDAGEIEHAVLHGAEHALPASGADALIERADDAECEVQTGAAVADLRAGDERRTLAEAGGGGGAARALRDILVDLAVLVGAGAEALDRGHDHARIGLVNVLPGQAHAVERAGREILHQHVAVLDQPIEDLLALGMLGVDGDRALAAVEHGEIEAVGAFDVAQLAARDVADAGPLDLDHVGAHISEQLRAGRARLHVGEIEDAHAVERLAGFAPGFSAGTRQAVRDGLLHRRLFRLQLDDLLRRRPGFGFGFGLRFGLGFHFLALR